jgi:hypothetical protein
MVLSYDGCRWIWSAFHQRPKRRRAFLADKDENKRAKVVEALIRRGEFADLMAMRWADLLRVDRAGAGAEQARASARLDSRAVRK